MKSPIIAATYDEMSALAFNQFIQSIPDAASLLICPASGDSPNGFYREMVNSVKQDAINISNWNFVGLDEWVGMDASDEGSCRHSLNKHLFSPLAVPEKRISFFNGKAKDLVAECKVAEDCIALHGNINLAIVGLGMNGHIGFNEPGVSVKLRTHIIDLQPTTKQVGQKYFKVEKQLNQGITLGMATLLEADQIILLVSGSHKAEIVRRLLKEEISNALPGSLLLQHPGLKIYLDEAAASLL